MNSIIDYIEKNPIIPIFYSDNIEICKKAVKASYEGGVRLFEFVNRGEKAVENFKLLIDYRDKYFPDLKLGIGTIKNDQQAEIFSNLNSDFLVSPIFDNKIAKISEKYSKFWIPGCMTPTEINNAEIANCKFIKLFPGNILDVKFLKSIKSLFPNLKFMSTGGINLDKTSIKSWFNAGVSAIGIGSELFKKDFESHEVAYQLKNAFSCIRDVRKNLYK